MKKLAQILPIPLLVVLLTPAIVLADGMFVAPKFIWDKHKDINEPTQKAILVFDAGREDLILQVKYEGPVDEFGWLIPVPNLPTVQKSSMKCFYELSQYTQRHFEPPWHGAAKSMSLAAGTDSEGKAEPPVKVIEIKTVGDYEIAVLSTKNSGALAKWLDTNQFYFPTNKTDVLDAYVKQQWYFVAIKINLKSGLGPLPTFQKLASGELNPLQISFASDRCVFPLKISSVNGQPSEVQVYVLSPEPLVEKTMLEKKLPLIYSNDLVRAAARAQSMKNLRAINMAIQIHAAGGILNGPSSLPPLSPEDEKMFQKINETPEASPDDMVPFAKVTKADLPDCSKLIPRLADKSWWLTKQTWTFQPEEMRDLIFEPAIPIFAEKLGTKYGYYAVASLASYQAAAVPALLAALQNTNPVVRANAASFFDRGYETINDPRLTEAAPAWLKDSEPKVRLAAVVVLTEYPNWNPKNAGLLVARLRDEDAGVRHFVAFALPRFRGDVGKYIPAIREMLKDKDLNIRASALDMLMHFGIQEPIPREDLLPLFSVPDRVVVGMTISQFRNDNENAVRKYDLSNEEIVPLLQNFEPLARMLGLGVLYQNADKESVDLALPLLKDPDQQVRMRTAATLRALTGQHFTADQPDQWQEWWTANKTNFVVQLHPEEFRSRLPNSPASDIGDRPPPAMPP